MSESGIGRLLLDQVKKYAQDAGYDCDIAGCEHVTLGFSCESCFKKLCNGHLYFQMSIPPKPMVPVCPSCIVKNHPEMFDVEADDDVDDISDDVGYIEDDDDSDSAFEEPTSDTIDAEFVEV